MTKKQQLSIWKNSSGKTCKLTPKLLFFDIDGTLLDYTGKMPASAKEALQQARLAGHRLVICSGRSGHQLSDWMFTDFDGIINCTGARVIFKQNVIYEHFVPRGKMSEEQGRCWRRQMAFWWHRQRNAQSFHRKAVYLERSLLF